MPMFGNKHFSNPAQGRMHEGMGAEPRMGGMDGMDGESKGKAKSYSVHHHEDGTAHSHIHHADDTHEHTDHASAAEAHDHVSKAAGEEEGELGADNESAEGEDAAAMQPMAKTFKPASVRRADSGAF